MIKPELYKKTIDILLKAYLNDTLRHDSCPACAVGNIICSSMGLKMRVLTEGLFWVDQTGIYIPVRWFNVFSTSLLGKCLQHITLENYKGEAKRQIDSTGYTVEELAAIEYAFETADKGNSEDDWMFNGLMAVVDVLDRIHEVEVSDSLKDKFVRA